MSLTFSGESAPGSEGNLGAWAPAAMRLAFQTVRWAVDRRKSLQCLLLAFLTSLKYADFAARISTAEEGLGCFLWALVLRWCSFLSEERSFDHQGLEREQGDFMGVWTPRAPLILEV